MKYFSPNYWLNLWVLTAPLFSDKTQGINAKLINNKNKSDIKNWVSKNTSLGLVSEQLNFTSTNQTEFINYKKYWDQQEWANNLNQKTTTEVSTTHKIRHLRHKNRNKRGIDGGNEIEFKESEAKIYSSFKPETWEEISFLYHDNNEEDFEEKFKDKMYSGIWKDWRIDNNYDMKKLGKTIYNNFWTIQNKFIASSRRERIRIVVLCKDTGWEIWPDNINIRTDDTHYYTNKYIKPDLYNVIKETQLGTLNDNNDDTIINIIKSKNNLADLKYKIRNKTNTSAEFWIDDNNNHYSQWSWKKVYFTIKPDLYNVIKETQLGTLNDNNDDTIINIIKSKNNLADLKYKIRNKTNTSAEFWIDDNNNHYSQWSWKKVYFTIKTDLDKFIKSLDPKISFLGSDMQERGVLWLDTAEKKIKFYPRTDDNGNQKTFGTYKNIIIKDQNDNTIKIITFNMNNTMSEILNTHNLNSKKIPNDGLDYEDGYSIEITSSQADTTWLKRNDDHDWMFNTSNGQHTEKLFIVNNWLWHKDYYLKKQRNEINLKRNLNLPTTFFQNNFYCKENNILTNINKDTILDKSKIILSSAIDNKNNVYISTDNGVYKINFEKNENWKIPGFNNDLISKIILDESDNPYFISVDGNAYFLTNHWFWWNSAQRIDEYHNVPEIKNLLTIKPIKSPDLGNKNGVYFATNHGVFYMKSFSWTPTKIEGIDEIIVKISIDTSGNTYFISVDGNAYYITNTFTWTAERIDIKHNDPEIKNVLSINEIPNSDTIFTNSDGVYFATNHGVFYMNTFSWTANKIGGINEIIAQITIDKNGNAYFISVDGNAYFLKNGWFTWTAIKIDDYYNPEIKNVLAIKTDNENIYYTTDHGVYIMPINNWTQIKKIDEINKIIAEITTSNNNLDCFKSFSSFENKENNKYEIKQNENPEIIVDDTDRININGLLNILYILASRTRDLYLMPVTQIERGYLNFVNSFNNVLNYLNINNIITDNNSIRGANYQLSNRNDGYFIVDIVISSMRNRRLQLVFRSSDLYMEGFINDRSSTGNYYYFTDSRNINNVQSPGLINRLSLHYDSNYNTIGSDEILINWDNIIYSFQNLATFDGRNPNNIRTSLVRVVFATVESWRFNNLYTLIAQHSFVESNSINWNNIRRNQLTNWATISENENNPLDIERIRIPRSEERHDNLIDLRHLEHALFPSLRICPQRNPRILNNPIINPQSNLRSQNQNVGVAKSGYTLEELRNQKYNTDYQSAIKNPSNFASAQQRFAQAQQDYNLHIQQGQPLPSNRGKRDVSSVENKFDDNVLKLINQEQHLPAIANHTNDVAKNTTTSL